MSPEAGMMLLRQIVPLIAAAVARGAVKPTGCEDREELQAEACALAAKALESAELRGKAVPASSVAFYAIESLKHGRRSGYAGQADVMSAAASLCGRVSLRSMDEAIGVDPDDPHQEFTLHDAITSTDEDVDVTAARRLDWDMVLGRLDDRRQRVLTGIATGFGTGAIADELRVSAPRICQLRESLGEYITREWGDSGLQAVTTPSKWRAGLRAATERRAGRFERRWKAR